MTNKFVETTTAKRISNQRLKSLLAPIPARVRDFLELKHGSQIIWTGEQVICICPDVVAFFLFLLGSAASRRLFCGIRSKALCPHINRT